MMNQTTSDLAIGALSRMPNLAWGEHPRAYHIGFIALPQESTFNLCEEVVRAVYGHHDIIRLRKTVEAEVTTFVVPPESDPFTLHLIDVSRETTFSKDEAVQSAVEELRVQFENSSGPFSLFAYCHYGDGSASRLAVLLDHIVFDNFGLKVLEDHILRGLSQRIAGKPIELPAKTISYREWGQLAREYVDSEEGRADQLYWRNRPWKQLARITPDYPNGNYDSNTRRHLAFALSQDQTRRLLEALRKQHGAQIMDALLCGLVFALQKCFHLDNRPVSIATILNERLGFLDGINTSRSLGNFATVPPIILDSQGLAEPGALLQTVCKQLREMPRGGKTYGWLAEFHPDGIKMDPPDVMFNYLGTTTSPGAGFQQSDNGIELDTLGLTSPMELELDRLMRWPEYSFDNLRPGQRCLLRLHFIEPVCDNPGERIFDIWINGRAVLRRFDIIKESGAKDRLVIKELVCAADESGRLTVNLLSSHHYQRATINALEVLMVDEAVTDCETVSHETCVPIYQINVGGPRVAPFQEDDFFAGGTPFTRTRSVDLTYSRAPAPLAVYDTERYFYAYTTLEIECQLYDRQLEFLIKYSGNMYRPERMRWFADTLADVLTRL